MFSANQGTAPALNGQKLRIGIVQARFNGAITQALHAACHAELLALGVQPGHIEHLSVPGALEIPLALQTMLNTKKFDALIALGCVIRGQTYHFELVANESAAAISRLGLAHHIPIANAILTTENEAQALERQTPSGCHAARVAVEMAQTIASYQEAR